MRMFAAIVPPRAVIDEIVAVVESVRPEGEPAPAPRRSLFRRRASGTTSPEADTGSNPELDRATVEEMYIPITNFGNVTLGDSVTLAGALREAVAGWTAPEVAFRGAAALEFTGDQSVWAKLTGDLDAVVTIGRGVPQVVQRLGFFVDRRVFRPWLSVGTITDATTAPYLERLVAALDRFHGATWTLDHVHLMQRPPEAAGTGGYEVLERMPLRGA